MSEVFERFCLDKIIGYARAPLPGKFFQGFCQISTLLLCLVMALFNHRGHCLQLQLVARPPGRQEFVEIEPGLEPKYPRA